ncbi:MAG TPA: hypothetical protein VLW85_25860 [Myxococcales bacterium]|nr:hypothetical protein [Myxococcales bacterium]
MDDAAFLAAIERCTLPAAELDHRAHLRLARLAGARTPELIKRYAASIRATGKYNETITQFWMRAVQRHRDDELLDKDLPLKHWSRGLLWSEAARAQWVEPDLRPLPF